MKHLINFDKHKTSKVNEMFDDDDLKNQNEIDFLSKRINKEEFSKTTKYYTNRIHQIILNKIPYFRNAVTSIRPNVVIYRFGDYSNTLAVVIDGTLVNDKYNKDCFNVYFYIEKNGECLNQDEPSDLYNIEDLIEYLDGAVPSIEKEFGVKKTTNLN